jgi:hypothetical protein
MAENQTLNRTGLGRPVDLQLETVEPKIESAV